MTTRLVSTGCPGRAASRAGRTARTRRCGPGTPRVRGPHSGRRSGTGSARRQCRSLPRRAAAAPDRRVGAVGISPQLVLGVAVGVGSGIADGDGCRGPPMTRPAMCGPRPRTRAGCACPGWEWPLRRRLGRWPRRSGGCCPPPVYRCPADRVRHDDRLHRAGQGMSARPVARWRLAGRSTGAAAALQAVQARAFTSAVAVPGAAAGRGHAVAGTGSLALLAAAAGILGPRHGRTYRSGAPTTGRSADG
jgi:hypothetical protein